MQKKFFAFDLFRPPFTRVLGGGGNKAAELEAGETAMRGTSNVNAGGGNGLNYVQTISRPRARTDTRANSAALPSTALPAQLLRHLFRHRRLQPDAGACGAVPCPRCLEPHLTKVRRFLRAGAPLHFVLPAFPAKSPNRGKTLSALPDLAEELALAYLQRVCDEIAAVYAPGARVTICSDGRIFSDLVGVSDEDVTLYGAEIKAIIRRLGARSLDVFNLEDVYSVTDYSAMREQVCARYAEPAETVAERVRTQAPDRALFNGIHRFLFEDRLADAAGRSRNQLRRQCKALAHEVIRRSNAWSRLIARRFPAALRLSIHPQPPHSEKIGILLGAANDCWITPWHGVAVRHGDDFKFMHRREAEALEARLAARAGRPSHYELDAPTQLPLADPPTRPRTDHDSPLAA
jgi:pyoverdine/dityrosine biosynthesis protein Dit1